VRGEQRLDLGACAGLVLLEREHVVPAAVENGSGDGGLRSHGVDGDQGAGQLQALQQQRDGGDLVGLLRHRFLPQHEPLRRRPGRDRMQRAAALGPGMAAPRGLAVDRDRFWPGIAQPLDPVREAGLEQRRVEGRDDFAQRVMARNAARERKEAMQEQQVLVAPQRQLDKIVGSRDGAAEQQKQQFRQGIQHLGRLPGVLQGCEMRQEGQCCRLNH